MPFQKRSPSSNEERVPSRKLGRLQRIRMLWPSVQMYIREFHRKQLRTFNECKLYYVNMPEQEMLTEAAWLMGDSVRVLPSNLTFYRSYALFEAMTEKAVYSPHFNDAQRMQFINTAIYVKEEMVSRADSKCNERLTRLVNYTCQRIKEGNGRYKKAADLIRNSIRDYPGPFSGGRKVIVHPGSGKMQ